MNINDYLEKLRSRPERQKEKIAVAATAVGVGLLFVIWLMSFSETNKVSNEAQQNISAENQLEDMKNSISRDQQSIEEMMGNLPEETLDSTEQDVAESVPAEQQAVPDEDVMPSANENNAERIPNLP